MKKILSTLLALTFIITPLADASARTPATGLPKYNGYSPREFVYGGSQHYNIVKNLMTGDASQLTTTYLPNTTGCVETDSASSTTFTATSSGTARCYLFQTITGLIKPDTYYVFGAEFSNIVGSFTGIDMALSGTVTEGGATLVKSASGRYAIGFKTPSSLSALQVRVGAGTNADETWAAGDSITISNPFLYEVPNLQIAPNEFVFQTAVLPYQNTNATSSGNVIHGATTTQYNFPSKRGDSVLIIGHSFCNDSGDWQNKLKTIANRAVSSYCISGNDLSDFYTQYTAWLASPTGIYKSYYQQPKTVIFNSPINDILAGASLATIQARTNNLANLAKTNGMIPVFMGATPFGQYASWDSGKQAVLDAHRAWMRASSTDYFFVDPYEAFEMSTTSDALAQGGVFGVSGDGLHPVGSGMNLLAQFVENNALKMIDRLSN